MRKFVAFGSLTLVVAACGGTQIGEVAGGSGAGGSPGQSGAGGVSRAGTGGLGTAGSSTGGTPSGTGGASTSNPCLNKPCGAQCSTCAPGQSCTAVVSYCDASGQCSPNYPVCSYPACLTSADCPQPLAACQQCPDGSFACPTVECISGQCVGSFPSCNGQTCTSDTQCPQSLAPCQICPDGSTACPYSLCVNGSCVTGTATCTTTDPCGGKMCGDQCSPCGSVGCGSPVAYYCDANLTCQPGGPPACGTATCKSDLDCPATRACPMCPDQSCATLKCLSGSCQWSCPTGPCGGAGESCCQGSCQQGLVCCAGIPYPPEGSCQQGCYAVSDRNVKWNIESIPPESVLERVNQVPISVWSYQGTSVRHIGPMAQDFHAAFGFGSSDRVVDLVDANGVAFASIQALTVRLEKLEKENSELKKQVDTLSRTLGAPRRSAR